MATIDNGVMYGPPRWYENMLPWGKEEWRWQDGGKRVVAGIIMQGNQVMAAQRGKGSWQGWWEFPGGKVEKGESGEEALRRELKEELDAELEVVKHYDTLRDGASGMVIDFYLCVLKDGHYRLNVHSDVRWLNMDELESVRWLPTDREIVKKLAG